ncbi:MAG: PhzF family phenazine biosynthesis protein [Gemmatimonadota bacterium]|nr:PhzF family phenazine biosynthesis protein [Gemmatimonadota bacterium]MDE2864638.1 PhzF family phenazine biosynthesis protein [Gemmatimonadota bacterium]
MTGQGIPFYTVDAFTDTPFSGNPAAVCLEIDTLPDRAMANIAREMNLSETAFVYRAGEEGARRLRWFTPAVEVPLCGHATLASAHVLLREVGMPGPVRFHSLSGPLAVHVEGDRLRLDFPANPAVEAPMPAGLAEALGVDAGGDAGGAAFAVSGKVALVVVGTEAEVLALRPDFGALARVVLPGGVMGVAATAPGADPDVDFVSRFFAPWVGVDEDPVTGVAHTTLTPWWSRLLGRAEMSARQRSARGGALTVRDLGDRVELVGQAVTVARGHIVGGTL